jgi:hypothetical protein
VKRTSRRLDADRRFLGKRVGRHDGEHGVMVAVAAQRRESVHNTLFYLFEVQIDADDPG